ncbi:acyl carrier protein [Trinickia sp. Y13]|uniref:acyl carrier protein n=1 Tax=Trinickia sp. Y13 TaxID=2917807 RepID=UPI0024067D1F|nr:acyl carrier protein [Trinickia sp. Y13]MDG0023002.1 acyl carrier protein [Trinickia sp. Y13]
MNDTDVRTIVVATLKSIAPELEAPSLRDDRPLRLQVDLDSIDWLNFLLRLHERLDVEIPEADYQKLVTLADIVTYLVNKVNSPHKSGR